MTEESDKNLVGALEALLFSYGEALSIKKIASLLGVKEAEIVSASESLGAKLTDSRRGLAIVSHQNSLQLVSSPEFSEIVGQLLKQEFQEELTPAAQETLAIIAYTGPISRTDVEYIRGVNSSFTVRNLMLRGLIERTINPNKLNSYVYSLSSDCLKHLGLKNISELPEYEKYKNFSEQLKPENQANQSSENVNEV